MVAIPVRLYKAARRERIKFHNVYTAEAPPDDVPKRRRSRPRRRRGGRLRVGLFASSPDPRRRPIRSRSLRLYRACARVRLPKIRRPR